MSPQPNRPTRVDAILLDVLKDLASGTKAGEKGIPAVWSDVVGREVARRTRPGTFRKGILFVKVSSSTWMQELEFLKESKWFENWQSEPVKPDTHEHAPPTQVPTPLHGIGSLGLHADASAGASSVDATRASAASAANNDLTD